MPPLTPPNGLFIGLTTLDLIYYTDQAPTANQKAVATELAIAAGGPATNAAVVFAAMGGYATVLSAIGCHPLAQMIAADLEPYRIRTLDLEPDDPSPPCLSSITVSTQTGDRSVISRNTQGRQQSVEKIPPQGWTELQGAQVVLTDGHELAVSLAMIKHPRARQIPTILDGGSWKPGLEKILPYIDYMICSAKFKPPGCGNELDVVQYLLQHQPHARVAITHDEKPIQVYTQNEHSQIPCPIIQPLDTLGAGDFFHGAFCAEILRDSFERSLLRAAKIASQSCQTLGPRKWLSELSFTDISP